MSEWGMALGFLRSSRLFEKWYGHFAVARSLRRMESTLSKSWGLSSLSIPHNWIRMSFQDLAVRFSSWNLKEVSFWFLPCIS